MQIYRETDVIGSSTVSRQKQTDKWSEMAMMLTEAKRLEGLRSSWRFAIQKWGCHECNLNIEPYTCVSSQCNIK